MRLHRLDIAAFGPFGGTESVDFDDLSAAGLFLLHGPTGAGKTSVLDAVCYALYGSVPGARQSGQGMNLRSDHAAPTTRTEVRLELTVAGRRLEITRQPPWERPKKRGSGTTVEKAQSWLREYDAAAGAWKDLSRSHQEIGEEVTQLLGMSREQFCQVVLLPQGDFARFLRADAEARGRLLGRLFDTHHFAAVEKRLADRRRETEARVREGDAALLADAHRMHQAAGDAPDLPEPAPGDPGLADAVLAWAAVARSTARERLTIAHCARAAAQSARVAADRVLDDVREVARLQRRFAEARERAARLEERADTHREDRARMERGRKAEAVAPALELRDVAEAEHRWARAEEEDARARLSGEYADAGAAGLAAAARRAAEELGALESARRAERRLAVLLAEQAELDGEERADEGVLQDAEGWLAEWETTRAGLQSRIESAQEAAARAEQLAVRREPAEQRLAAARQRDQLGRDTDAAQARVLRLAERASEARTHWLDLKEQRLSGIAAELAAGLVEGRPCAVCGGTEHPAPARKVAGHVDREAEEDALAAFQRADEERADAERQLGVAQRALAAASAEAGDTPTERLAATVAELEREQTEARRRAVDLHPAQEALLHAEQERDRRAAARQEAAVRAASRDTRRDTLERERATLEAELTQARGDAESVAELAGRLEARAARLGAAAEAARVADDTAQRLKDADARLADAAFRAGFDTPRDAAAAVLDDAAHRDLQRRLDAWQSEEAAVRAVLAEAETTAAGAQPPADLQAAEREAEAAARRLQGTVSAWDAAERRRTELDRLSARATAAVRGLAPLREEHDRIARLAGLAAGTSADNERRMRLEAYVLAARLEQVAAAATVRLQRMSSGRYTLVHSDDRAGRGRSGLGLHVVDAWTGRERDTATLSGGETFFASLALALGLADVVTDEAGGVRLDTLFIDEGFGSLDEQTLDEVLDVLDALRERDRSVGIVSHVADLRRRVHAQLEVVKERTGSVVRQRGQ
ncbi:AAA family ATPase [Streptomyces caniscabiei]|uniref:Nuclease SbcCD subunit C n=2 Tax=Streptomyces caniscabiei TaxID=2746961 RepID=A0ABU4MLM1_9ACTN|nr:SMC family ATPase [Streptomyces caniscabiei]MBE4739248.1 SMC family ATPase [Streptomyces caniscabiei]MBE4758631.1 SMC family ATPase [Streptomyces caniscabiei]MBE4787880.1 SMC family ATPase [Streptomyces caniscabiei]MBE4797102.1 SMC family ATPase [Streptomyces caniscabiei]MDX2944142.1 SMC family ATPase [Streptomyces caniscabiei]